MWIKKTGSSRRVKLHFGHIEEFCELKKLEADFSVGSIQE